MAEKFEALIRIVFEILTTTLRVFCVIAILLALAFFAVGTLLVNGDVALFAIVLIVFAFVFGILSMMTEVFSRGG